MAEVGTMDLTSHVAALERRQTEIDFLVDAVADSPVFMSRESGGLFRRRQAGVAGAGWQIKQSRRNHAGRRDLRTTTR